MAANVNRTIKARGTGSTSIKSPTDVKVVEVLQDGKLALFGSVGGVGQMAAAATLKPTVAGDMPNLSAAEITTRLNLIENRLNLVWDFLNGVGAVAAV